MPLVQTLQPRFQPFDSGKLAPRVGNIILTDAETVTDDIAAELIDHAAADDFDLVWIESPARLETSRLDYRGTIIEVQGDRDTVRASLPPGDISCEVRPLETDSDWRTLEELMRFAAASRFTTDPGIPTAAFRTHKLALLRAHVENRQGVVSIAWSAEGSAVGYTCTSIQDQTAYVYDLAVDPGFRRGSVGRTLLRHNLERFTRTHPEIRRYVTRIYEDNIPCLRLFWNLGYVNTGRLFHYYHCWPKGRR
jgi:ribosomal protein S18 acetylase RimI-like enzyme